MLGVGGSGMSGLAELILRRGGTCSGTDAREGAAIDTLRAAGIPVDVGEPNPLQTLPEGCDLVIASAAIKPDHPLMVAAELAGIETISYAQAVGRAQIGHTAVSIAGLTVYDMCKAVDPAMVIEATRLLEKQGGKRGHWTLTEHQEA